MVEFLFFAVLSGLLDAEYAENAWISLSSKDSSAIIIAAATLFLASGAVGYIAASVYHVLQNVLFRYFDYGKVLRELTVNNYLSVFRLDGTQISFEEPNSRRDWVIFTVLWHERSETNQQIKAATERAKSLVDIAHGAGTLFVGSAFAWLFAMGWTLVATCPSTLLLRGLLGLILVVVHFLSFRWTGSVSSEFIATIVRNQVRYDCGKDHSPVLVYYSGK